MKQRVAMGLTLINAVVLTALLALFFGQQASVAQGAPRILRGSGLEIVDSRGRVRASITVYPDDGGSAAEPGYPEVVVLRLHDRNGKPTVKLDTHEGNKSVPKGSGLGLLGDTDGTQAFIGTAGATAKVE